MTTQHPATAPAPAAGASPNTSQTTKRDREAERAKLAAERAAAVLQADGLLRLREVLALVPVSASTWWEGVRTGRFPASVRVSARCVAWRAADIRALLASFQPETEA